MSTATRTQIEQVVPMSTKRSTDMAFQIEMYDRYGRWLNDWAGDPSDNVFATEAEAEAMLAELMRIFANDADADAGHVAEYRLVEVTSDGEPVEGGEEHPHRQAYMADCIGEITACKRWLSRITTTNCHQCGRALTQHDDAPHCNRCRGYSL